MLRSKIPLYEIIYRALIDFGEIHEKQITAEGKAISVLRTCCSNTAFRIVEDSINCDMH